MSRGRGHGARLVCPLHSPCLLPMPMLRATHPSLAQVACRMLGLTGGKAVPGAIYWTATSPHKLGALDCTGAETNLTQCKYCAAILQPPA